ncbi:MAG TPA: hypothetical protein PLQ67_05750 [Burkholderiaceae bacterium]|nr:hypothetical protein [Burkholderiaceae bacterium]
MRIYAVGGSVRDALMGIESKDRDWVVVGATPEQMRAAGFKSVGRDFPVFLHPQTHEEYALARTERKTAPGYHGFVFHAAPDVTLEQDLARRDLTINAMARDGEGHLIDPFGGARDIDARVLRHVGPAFSEDPVRILRVARFAARWPDFSVAPETMALMASMVAAGEADALVPERVLQELQRGLMEIRPSRMLAQLRACGLIERLSPQLLADEVRWQSVGAALDRAAGQGDVWPVRFAILASAVNAEALEAWLQGLRVDAQAGELARCFVLMRDALRRVRPTPEQRWVVLERGDALRRPGRFEWLLRVAQVLDGVEPAPWHRALAAASAVDAGDVARRSGTQDGARIAACVRQARIEAIERAGS